MREKKKIIRRLHNIGLASRLQGSFSNQFCDGDEESKNNRFIQHLHMHGNAPRLPPFSKKYVKSKIFGVSGEHERCEQTALLLVRLCKCRLQFVPFALFTAKI